MLNPFSNAPTPQSPVNRTTATRKIKAPTRSATVEFETPIFFARLSNELGGNVPSSRGIGILTTPSTPASYMGSPDGRYEPGPASTVSGSRCPRTPPVTPVQLPRLGPLKTAIAV